MMPNIARRYQQFFPSILPETYNPAHFHFRHTRTARTNTTIRAFASGLFGEAASQNVIFEDVAEDDTFLRPIDFCPEFRDEVADQHQQRAFENGPEFEEMMEQINRRLGFHGSSQLSVNNVLIMWEWCRFETATYFEFSEWENGDPSAWCVPFSVVCRTPIVHLACTYISSHLEPQLDFGILSGLRLLPLYRLWCTKPTFDTKS